MPQKPGLTRDLAAERAARKAASQQARLVPQGLPTVHPNQLMPSPENGRKQLLKVDELAETLRSDGMNTAMTVIPPDVYVTIYPQHKEAVEARVAEGALFVVHHGHRRLAAALKAELTEVPILVRRDVPSLRIAAIQENLQRMGLNPIEEAAEFQGALDEKDDDGKQLSQRELAKRVGCSQTYVSHRVALLRLAPALQQAVVDHWLKEQQLLDTDDGPADGSHPRLMLPVRDAATVYARLRPDLQEAFIRGELSEDQARTVSKAPAAEQSIPIPESGGDATSQTGAPGQASLPVPRASGSGRTAPSGQPAVRPANSGTGAVKTAAAPGSNGTTVPASSTTTVTPVEDPRGVIVVRDVEQLALAIIDLLDTQEIEDLKAHLSS
ncbi:hypothetical protein [Streptomyces galilaeus]|uniref:hypothetical protein n=1 Tax=Streptomyces galilaeus TaxID=33899 RepID=UPI0038F79AD1